jgi:hypothetical protein
MHVSYPHSMSRNALHILTSCSEPAVRLYITDKKLNVFCLREAYVSKWQSKYLNDPVNAIITNRHYVVYAVACAVLMCNTAVFGQLESHG